MFDLKGGVHYELKHIKIFLLICYQCIKNDLGFLNAEKYFFSK